MAWANIDIDPGVIRQATPYDVPNKWWDTSNVRWVSGAMCPIGGNTKTTSSALPSVIRKLFQWRDNSSNIWTIVGMENSVHVEYANDYDVTPSSFVGISNLGGGGFGVGTYSDPSPILDPAGTTIVKTNVVSISIASPCVITWTSHGLTSDCVVKFTTTGSLPTGLTVGTAYYVIPVDANTFKVCLASGGKNGTVINTSGTQSGVQSANWIVGQDTYGRQRSSNPPQYRTPDFWSFAAFGQDLLAVCSSDGRLLHFTPTTGTPAAMDVPSNAPTSNTAVLVTAERACVLLGAGGNKRRVQWSDLENYNSWTATSTNQTGYIDLEATSPIVNGIRVKEGILILCQHEVFLMRYVGAPYYYGIEKLGSTTFSAPNALTIGANMAIWVGDESFWIYDGSSVRTLPCPFFNDLKQSYNPVYGNYRSHMHENGIYPEFWLDYPDIDSSTGENNSYVIWNYAENWWARGSRSITAMCGANTAKYPIGSKIDNNIYQFEDGWTENGISRLGTVWAETSLLNLGNGTKIVDVNQAMASIDPTYGSQNYQLKIYSRFAGDQSETTYGPYLPRSDGYTDTRAQGRDLRLRIEATNDNYWSLGPVRLDIQANGGER